MPEANNNTCPTCGTTIPEGAPSGLCPKCLLTGGTGTSPTSHPDPPEVNKPGANPQEAQTLVVDNAPATGGALPADLQPFFPELEIGEPLGKGGMGAVFRARQPRLNRDVALKLLVCPPEHHADFALRFEREAQTLARLNHPHIVTIFDFGERDELFYFLMEYVDGTDLNHLIRSGELEPEQALRIVPQICDALQFAHDEGITHRDIKPANILLDKKGQVKIADFGIAKVLGGGNDEDALATGLTLTGTSMGSPHYMAPEQWETPEKVDHRADIYSLGVVFYEMLTGERPLGAFKLPSEKSDAIDARLDDVVLRAMDKEPDERYQQATEVKDEVTQITTSPNPVRKSEGEPRSKTPLLATASLLLIAAALLFALDPFGWRTDPNGGNRSLVAEATSSEQPVPSSPVPGNERSDVSNPKSPFPLPRPIRPATGGEAIAWHFANGFDGEPKGLAILPEGLDDVVSLRLSAGTGSFRGLNNEDRFVLALHADGRVSAWGRDAEGETQVPENLKPAVAIAAGQRHAVVLQEDGTVRTWGWLKDDKLREEWRDIVAIAAANGGTLGLTADGRVLWAGPNSTTSGAVPDAIQGRVTRIVAAQQKAAAVLDDGTVRVWGSVGEVDTVSLAAARNVVDVLSTDTNAGHLYTLDTEGRLSAHFDPADPAYPPKEILALTGITRVVERINGDLKAGAVFSATDHTWHIWDADERGRKRAEGHLAAAGHPEEMLMVGASFCLGIREKAEPSAAPSGGRLRAVGTAPKGNPPDLSKVAELDDLVDVGGRIGEWVVLRANGETISSNGQADFTDIRRIAVSFAQKFALIDREGKIRFPENSKQNLPPAFDDAVLVDVQLGDEHGIALTDDGGALVFGRRYEEQVGDPTKGEWFGTPRWPRPPEDILKGVKDIAVTQTHAAVLQNDGTLSVFGWEGVRELPQQKRLARIEAIGSSEDMIFLLDANGQVWKHALPRNPAPEQPVLIGGRYITKLETTESATALKGPCWVGKSGRWHSFATPVDELLEENGVGGDRPMVAAAGVHAGRPYQSLLWIEPAQ